MQHEPFDAAADGNVGEHVAVEDEATCADEGVESHVGDEDDAMGEVEQGDRLLTYLCRTSIFMTNLCCPPVLHLHTQQCCLH